MPRIRISLREIHVIKLDDGGLFQEAVELYPCLKFNGSTVKTGLFGPEHGGLKSGRAYPFNDILLEVDIPTGEFAELSITWLESDVNHSQSEALRDRIIPPLPSYEIKRPELMVNARALVGGNGPYIGPGPVIGWEWERDWEEDWEIWSIIAAIIALFTLDVNNDDVVGSWRTRIEALPEGVYFASKGAGPNSGLNTKVIGPIVKLNGGDETAIPKLSYWIHEKAHVEYSMTAQVIG